MPSKDKMDKMELRQSYQNVWQTDLMNTVTVDLPYCCFSCWCGQCASFLLRKRALYNDMSRYECCAGYMPCSGKCGEKSCPQICLCTEVFLCFGNSVASTRFLLQDEFNIQTTKCDNCIIGFMFCLNQLACIFSLIAMIVGSDEINEASHLLNCLADMVYLTVCACMQTQHKIELDKRDGVLRNIMVPPPVQQMSRIDQPTVGYPAQQLPNQSPSHDHQSPLSQDNKQPPPSHDQQPPPPPPQTYGNAPQGYPGYTTQPQGYPGYAASPQGYPAPPPQGYPTQAYPPSGSTHPSNQK